AMPSRNGSGTGIFQVLFIILDAVVRQLAPSRASHAPTGFVAYQDFELTRDPVGAGLPAMASCQPPHASRPNPVPNWMGVDLNISILKKSTYIQFFLPPSRQSHYSICRSLAYV
ncbi:MAG TPA: hypothetical protein VN214_12560, partial [Pseudomonas sp.]|nr:hypothetical protein [Pseudomonas sp.]